MSLVLPNRVKDTATSITGTGAYTCAGSPPTGFLSFNSGVGDGGQTLYKADNGAGIWEINKGTYTNSTKALTRDIFLDSSTGSPISWSSATPTLTVVSPSATQLPAYHPGLSRSRWYARPVTGNITGLTLVAGTIYTVYIYVPDVCTLATIGVDITTLVAGNIRFGVYAAVDGAPGNLLYDSGSQAAASGINTASPSLQAAIGWYFLALQSSSASIVAARAPSPYDATMLGFPTVVDTSSYSSIVQTGTFGALPNPFGAPTYDSLHNIPELRFQVT